MTARRIAILAMYTAIALTIFIIESLLPNLAPFPGMKLGLANIVTLWLLIYASPRDAFTVLILRILISSMVAGQSVSFAYSLCGGILCFLVTALLFRFPGKKYLVFISMLGAMCHNLGQIALAAFLVHSTAVFAYLPILTLSASVTGAFTGLCALFASKRLRREQVWPL